MPDQSSETHYINTDLDLNGPLDLAPLVKHLSSHRMHAPHFERVPRKGYIARFETNRQYAKPQATITAILSAIEAMPRTLEPVWGACAQRCLNIGYQCGAGPHAIEHGLSSDVLRRMAEGGLSLGITLYRVDGKQ